MKQISLEIAGRIFNIQIPSADVDVEEVIYRYLDKNKKHTMEDLLKAYMTIARAMAMSEDGLNKANDKLKKALNVEDTIIKKEEPKKELQEKSQEVSKENKEVQ